MTGLVASVGRARLPVLGLEGRRVLVFHQGCAVPLEEVARLEGVALAEVTLEPALQDQVAGQQRWMSAIERRIDRALRKTEAVVR